MMIIRNMKCSLTLMILYFSILISSGYALAEENHPNILILNSYHQGENWTDNEIAGIFSELQTQYPHLVPLVEILDTKRYPSPAHLDFLKDYLLRKYHDRRIDLIIALDNPALNLITQNPTGLFPDVPIVFAGINGFRPEMIADRKKITGVIERQDVAGTLKMALAMHPKVSRILAVHDYTASGLAVRHETETALAEFAGKLQISYSADVPFDTLNEELKEMPDNGLVLILTYVTDKAGRTFTREESTRLITSLSPAPVYAMHETRLGFGIMGGLLLEGKEHGRQAARLALRVLQGEDPDKIAVEESQSRSILDYEGLRRFQIPEDLWPQDALVVNHPISFWSLHKNVLIPSIAAIIVLLGLSLMLLGTVIRLRHAKKKIHKSEEKYRVLFNSFPLGITVSDQDGKIVETNAISTTILGVSREEQEKRKVDGAEWRIIRPDGTPMPVGEYAATRALQEKRMVENVEMGIVKPDAGITWIIVTAAPLNLENYGVVVTYLDVTARRGAEEGLRERESLFRTLVNTIPDLIWLKDTNGVYLSCNKKFEPFFGASETDIVGKTDYDFVDEELADSFRENDRKAIAVGGPSSNEEQITFADDGHKVFLDTIKMPMFGADGKLIGVLGIGRDITERKQAEEALRESEAKFRAMVETFPLAIHQTVGVEQITEYVNPTMVKLFGYTRADIPSVAQWWPLAYPDETYRRQIAEEWTKRVKHAIATQSPIEPMEVVCTCKDGSKKNISWGYITLGDKNYSCGLDITERKQAEEAVRKSEELLSRAQEIAHTGSWKLDLTANHLTWSDEVYRIFGYEPQEFAATYEGFLDAVHPDDRALVDEIYSRSLREGSDSYELEHRIVRRNSGEVRYVLERCVHERDDAGTIIQSTGMVQDITKRKQAEEKLRLSEECFKALTEASFGGIIIHDKGLILECNKGLSDITDFSYEEHIGMNGLELIAPESMDTVLANIRSGYEQGYEVSGVRKDGSKYPLAIRGKNITYKGREARVIEFRDITEHKQSEKDKEILTKQLMQAQKMEAVGQLAGGVAHDFNNMLGVITGYSELILEQIDPTQQFHAELEEIQKAARRSADLTRQLLTFARKQTVAPQVLDLNQTIEGMLTMLRRLIGENIDLIWMPGSGLWPINMDPSQIDQILANLCVNGRDAIAGVGKLTVETKNASFDKEYCATHVGSLIGDYVRITVSDTGSGMDKETLAHIFEPFFTTKEVGEGTGLGLATVYGAVKQNNGFINAYSEPGQGTTFTIYIPRHVETTAETRVTASPKPVVRGDEIVILVEDEPTLLQMSKIMLERLGYTVLAAGTPSEAIRLAGEFAGQIHLLATDVIMPEMNGRQLSVRLLESRPEMKCLFMSGYTANIIANQGVLKKGVPFIQKPFSKNELAAKVREALES